jgi:hypothetical protein
MFPKETVVALMRVRGLALVLFAIGLFALAATPMAGGLRFDTCGRVFLAVAGVVPGAIGVLCILRDAAGSKHGDRSDCPLRGRDQLPQPLEKWKLAMAATDILMIGQNLNIVFRQQRFFARRLQEGLKLRLVIVDPSNKELISILKRGVVESSRTEPDFVSFMHGLAELRQAMADDKKDLIDLRTIDYIPTLSFQMVDGHRRCGTIIVELTPNKMEVPNRPHVRLDAGSSAHRQWFDRVRENCEQSYNDAKPWKWD